MANPLSTLIVCFSQTGNTWKVAQRIRDGIIAESCVCNLIDIKQVDINQLSKYDLVGLGYPVFYYQEPFNIRSFIENLPQLPEKKWFVFCSHGSVMGTTLVSMTLRLEEKGIMVIGSNHTYAEITIPFYPHPSLTAGHPDEHDLKEAFNFGRQMAQCTANIAAGRSVCIQKPELDTEKWVTEEMKIFTPTVLKKIMPALSINSETCISCGECESKCPVNGIDISTDPPLIQNPCIFCWHCVNICPTCSIEADWSDLIQMAPANYKRYIEALNKAQKKGEFRWLIDPDAMNYNNPLCRQRKKKIK